MKDCETNFCINDDYAREISISSLNCGISKAEIVKFKKNGSFSIKLDGIEFANKVISFEIKEGIGGATELTLTFPILDLEMRSE